MDYFSVQEQILAECALALSFIDEDETQSLIDCILGAEKVFFVAVGRVLISLQSMCKRFNHLGIEAFYVGQIDEPAITDKDLLIVASGSGESLVPVALSSKAKEFGASIAYIGSNQNSLLARIADIFIRIPVRTKLCLSGETTSIQPMTSLFEQVLFLYGDILAMMIISQQHIDVQTLWQRHANLE